MTDAAKMPALIKALKVLAPIARRKLARYGASHAAWEAVREAEALVNGMLQTDLGYRDVGFRFAYAGLRQDSVERAVALVGILTRRAV